MPNTPTLVPWHKTFSISLSKELLRKKGEHQFKKKNYRLNNKIV